MGSTTTFTGSLQFVNEPSLSELKLLQTILGADCRDHDWESYSVTYIDFELMSDYTGIVHTGAEKSEEVTEQINVILREMRKHFPRFGFSGQLLAQGEEVDDRWAVIIESDGWAHERKITVTGTTVTCPHCKEDFILEQ